MTGIQAVNALIKGAAERCRGLLSTDVRRLPRLLEVPPAI